MMEREAAMIAAASSASSWVSAEWESLYAELASAKAEVERLAGELEAWKETDAQKQMEAATLAEGTRHAQTTAEARCADLEARLTAVSEATAAQVEALRAEMEKREAAAGAAALSA
jgi:chromosome segregation ATPase